MKELNELIELFKKFPGIGPRQAERFAYFITRSNKDYVNSLLKKIKETNELNKICEKCFKIHFRQDNVCEFCADDNRDKKTLIIVEKEVDVYSIESVGELKTFYFVLGNLIQIDTDILINNRIKKLKDRIEKENIEEVILVFSAHPDADHTTSTLNNFIKKIKPNIKISSLARGISTGAEIEYTDLTTLKHSIKKREFI